MNTLPQIKVVALLSLLAVAVCSQPLTAADKKPLQVFILAGQSNM